MDWSLYYCNLYQRGRRMPLELGRPSLVQLFCFRRWQWAQDCTFAVRRLNPTPAHIPPGTFDSSGKLGPNVFAACEPPPAKRQRQDEP
eukprot:4763704-Pyramimonas_sp.AAC.1